MFSGRVAVMCCLLLAGCEAERPRETDPTADTSVTGGDSSPAQSSTTAPVPKDSVIVLGTVERDLTGDGQPEILRLTAVGRPADSLDVTFVIESAGYTLFREQLRPLTRSVGFDAGRRKLSPAEYRTRLDEFDDWFFGPRKFMQPEEYVEKLRRSAPGSIAEIPDVIARARARQIPSEVSAPLDSAGAAALWDEIRQSGVTVFNYSRGGDATTAIAWSARDRRFYPLLECC
jgi:hypothetical protein